MDTLATLETFLRPLAPGGLCVAFSGGVDSAALLALCRRVGSRVHAVTLYTPLHTPTEPREAAELARELGATHAVLRVDTIPQALLDNPTDRCYLCKKDLFSRILAYAREQSLATVLDGTNADDHTQYRPGLRALKELGVRSPFAECGIHKPAVREAAAVLGLRVANKPSAPCLATRFPYGTRLTPEALHTVGCLEESLRALDLPVVRARVHGNTVRIEVPPEDFAALLAHRERIVRLCGEAGFSYVTLDLQGFRSGSMDLPEVIAAKGGTP